MRGSIMRIRRFAGTVSVATCLLVAGAGLALAEGGFTSSFSSWLPGSSSRDRADRNVDAAATTVKPGGCRFQALSNFSYTTIQVSKRNGILPDQNQGQKSLYCSSSATGNWGRLGNATYRFTMVGVNGSGVSPDRVDASSVVVAY